MGGLPGGGAKVRGRPFPAPWVTVASPRALEARRDLNSNLRPGKDCPAFCGRSRGSARLVASGPRGDRGRGLGCGVVAMETSRGRSLPHPEREEQNAQLVGIQLLGAPVQRNQHYYFLEYFYLHHFLCSAITQQGYSYFIVSVTWPRSRRRLLRVPPLCTTFCNARCAPEVGCALSFMARSC